ncbi:MAG: glycogen debranching protein [Bacteroidetes bacterium HGW-Bacteroidetes-4]|jgi:predicted glycogen debranching enzyme|nr:MAG: glycogen debranching protein [Bacteroidetes bacterium HGW-Bacteroidetes-4]
MLKFSQTNAHETLNKEWLVTNGIGGYASSTISGANTRRYHGLLVAALNPPIERKVLVSKIEESIIESTGEMLSLSSNYFPGVVHPNGYQQLVQFERNPLPSVVFTVNANKVCKTIFMVHGSNTTVVEYENKGEKNITMSLNPFYVYRDYHSLYHEDTEFCHYYNLNDNILEVFTCHNAPLYIKYSSGKFNEAFNWFKNYQYPEEQLRGQDYSEDAFSLGNVDVKLKPGEKIYLTFSTENEIVNQLPEKLKQTEIKRLKALIPKTVKSKFLQDLIRAADQFVVDRKLTQSKSIIAGYHWFTDWGRDTMIAMQGLTIAIGKQAESKSILKTFFNHLDSGMLPNRFPDDVSDQPEYNTIDATLWLFVALYKYYKAFGDAEFAKENFHYLDEIIQAHIQGTRYNIHVTDKGFLFGGEGIAQLTWMDARIGDYVVTPRHGCPVEIQALWYNALQIYLYFGKELKCEHKTTVKNMAEKIKTNFLYYFLNDGGYLNDVINPDGSIDASIRPNQIYALSLPFPIINKKTGKNILKVVEKHLSTPYGLRSLSPFSTAFKPFYEGNQWNRDTAYHQGTVWTFLLADYFQACLYVYGNTPDILNKINISMSALEKHFYESECIHGVSEIFDGLNPETGKGTVHQAWSVSALIQILQLEQGINASKKLANV